MLERKLGTQLGSLRKDAGLSLRELAELVGGSQVSVWKWENGRTKPRTGKLRALASALHTSVAELTGIQETSDGNAIQLAGETLGERLSNYRRARCLSLHQLGK